jgi:hypothetical protein
MIVRPKNQLELAQNLKYIFDHDLVLQDEFYTEASLKDLFGLDAIRRSDDATTSGDGNISIVSSKFSSIFPQSKSLESQKFIPGANLTGGKTTFKSGVIAAAINFSMDEGGPSFDETWAIFGNKFIKLEPQFPGTFGGPLPARAPHGNENWRRQWIGNETERVLTLGFNRDAELSNIIIEIKNK